MKRSPKTKDACTSNQKAEREDSLHGSSSWFCCEMMSSYLKNEWKPAAMHDETFELGPYTQLDQLRLETACPVGQVKGHPNGLDDLPLPLG